MSVLGLDIGTTGVKSVAFSPEGVPLASSYQRYSLIQEQPGWAELDPREVSRAILSVVRSVASQAGKGSIVAVCSTALGEAVVPVDKAYAALDNSIIAIDHRAEAETAAFAAQLPPDEFFGITGQLEHPIASLFKILWWKEKRPEVFRAARRFFCWNEMLAALLGVEPATSPSLAARMGIYDLTAATWSGKILEAAGLSPDLFAPVAPAGSILGEVPPTIASDLGLARKCLLVCGGWDQACAALGAGAYEPGVVVNAMGTTDSLNATFRGVMTSRAMMESGLTCTPHPLDGLFCTNAFSTGGGNLLSWYRDLIVGQKGSGSKEAEMALLVDRALATDPGALMVLPHFIGSGTPAMDPQSLGCIFGLTTATTREALLCAILEGIALEMWVNLECLVSCGLPVERIHVCGGAAHSRATLEMRSDLFGRRLIPLVVDEAGCVACGILATSALDPSNGPATLAKRWVRTEEPICPDQAQSAAWGKKKAIYSQLYPTVKSILHDMRNL